MRRTGMKRSRRCFLFVLAAVSAAGQARAQESFRSTPPTDQDTSRISTLQFSRSLQTFLWNSRVGVEGMVGGLFVEYDQNLRSRLIRSVQNSIQDEVGARIQVSSRISESWSVGGEGSSMVLADNRQLDLGNLSQHRLLAGPVYHVRPNISVALLGGYELASQEGQRDHGGSFRVGARGDNARIGDFTVSFDAQSGRSFLSPRKLSSDGLRAGIVSDYGQAASNTVTVRYGNQGREFYVDAGSDVRADYGYEKNIFRRVESSFEVADTIRYRSGEHSLLHVHAGYGNRRIDRGYRYKSFSNPGNVSLDSRIDESRIFGGVAVRVAPLGWLRGMARLDYDEREEIHEVLPEDRVPRQIVERQEQSAKRLSNIARRSTVGLGLRSQISDRNLLNLTGSASILRYDTPDTLNTDDRDELLVVVGIESVHRIHESLAVSVLADLAMSHLVYLSRFQSANNNWNRVIRLKSRVAYSLEDWLTTVNSAEVLANYTVYDFQEQIASVRSFSFRQAAWSDSTSLRMGSRTSLIVLLGIRVYERGILKWQEFRERPEHYFLEESHWPQMAVRVTDHLSLSVGYRYFGQSRYRYDGRRRIFERKLVNEGPTVRLTWRGRRGSVISLDGWRETQKGAGPARSYSNVTLFIGAAL